MNTTMITLAIGLVAIAAFFGMMIGIQWYLAKGKDPGKALDTADKIVDTAVTANQLVAATGLIPAPAESIIDKVLQVAQAGVHNAEQLYQSGQMPPDLRKDDALTFAKTMLKIGGYEVTPDMETALQGAIQNGVFLMSLEQQKLKLAQQQATQPPTTNVTVAPTINATTAPATAPPDPVPTQTAAPTDNTAPAQSTAPADPTPQTPQQAPEAPSDNTVHLT